MNPKIFVIAAISVLVGILGVIFISTSTFETSEDGTTQVQNRVESISVELEEITITQVTDRSATIEIQFKLENPNDRSVIASLLSYSLYGSVGSSEYKIASGEIGDRPEGMVDGSNYYTLLSKSSVVLKDKIILESPGNSPELMSILEGNPKWRVEGDLFFNLSSMTSGQENEIHFELSK